MAMPRASLSLPCYCVDLVQRSCCPLEQCPRKCSLSGSQSRKALESSWGQGSRARVEGWATTGRGHLVFNSCTGQTRVLCPLGLHAAEELVTSTLSLPLCRMGQGTTLPSSQGVRGWGGGVLAIFSGLFNFHFFKVYL